MYRRTILSNFIYKFSSGKRDQFQKSAYYLVENFSHEDNFLDQVLIKDKYSFVVYKYAKFQ
jgi:hypothetical protein